QAPRISAIRENASTLAELKDYLGVFDNAELNDKALAYLIKTKGTDEIAYAIKDFLTDNINVSFEELVTNLHQPDLKKRDIFMILRTFITGRKDGPPLKEIFPLVPADTIARRIDTYLRLKGT
ncbi:MAG: hypothetical protein ACYDHW_16750, partial [Syntrophorhabdaceae bacterium]